MLCNLFAIQSGESRLGSIEHDWLSFSSFESYVSHFLWLFSGNIYKNEYLKKYSYLQYQEVRTCLFWKTDMSLRDPIVQRYHNNTHKINSYLSKLNFLFHCPRDHHSFEVMCKEFCYYYFMDHFKDISNLVEFCTRYLTETPVGWYRRDSFIYPIVNRVLRQKNFTYIYRLHYFMFELYDQLDRIHKQEPQQKSKILTVYRGQQMHLNELIHLATSKNELLYNNVFLSTTFDRKVACIFAGIDSVSPNPLCTSVLFEIEIDTSHNTRPYAHIIGSGDEDELIITPGFVFRLLSIERDKSPNVSNASYIIQLKSDNDRRTDLDFFGETFTVMIGPTWRS